MIKLNNIILRPITRQDITSLNKWKNDKDVYKFLGGGFNPISIDQQSKWLDSMIDLTGNSRRYIIQTSSEVAIGMIGLYNINWIHRTAEIGLFIGEKNNRGQGYGFNAYQALEGYVKNYLNLRKFKIYIVNENQNAVKFWNKCGFELVGTLRSERFIENQYYDLLIMEKFIQGGN